MNRKLRYLVPLIAMSLAWPLRGQFGHLNGALIPGAVAALLSVIFFKEEIWRKAFGAAVIFSSLGFSLGGHLGYGKTIEAILTAPALQTVPFHLLRIFLIGAVWGGLGLSFLGFAFSEKSFVRSDLFLLALSGLLWFIPLEIFNTEAYDLALFGAGLAVMHVYNFFIKKSRVLSLFGGTGILGFGLGFLFSVLLLYAGTKGQLPGGWPWWNLRDQFFGFFGGLAMILVLHRVERLGLFPAPEILTPAVQKAGFIFFTVLIPLINSMNVLTYWFLERHYLSQMGVILCVFVLSILFAGIFLIFLRIDFDFFIGRILDRTLFSSVLFFIWFLSLAAIVKSILPFGFSRWEPAFSLFLMDAIILSFFLSKVIYRKSFD